MPRPSLTFCLLLAILAAALGIRLAAGVWWQRRLPEGTRFAFGDSESYWQLGHTIARGQPYQYGEDGKIFRTPGYPALLAALFWLRGDSPLTPREIDPLWGRVLGAVLGTLAVGGVAALAWQLLGERGAIIAAAIAAIYPEAIALSVFVLSEAPFCPLMLCQMHAWTKAWRTGCHKTFAVWAFGAGVAAGLATLMRPSWLLFTPFAISVAFAFAPDRPRQLRLGGLMLLAFCLTMLPWWARNFQVAGRFVPTSLQVGASLYDGISPTATGASEMSFVPPFVAEQHAADAEAIAAGQPLRGLFEDRLDRRIQAAAVAWAKANPGRVAQLAWTKLLRIWSPLPNASDLRGGMLRWALALTYTPLMLAALLGGWKLARRDWPYLLCLLPAVYFTGLHLIFVSSIRYRQPAMLPLIILAVGAMLGGGTSPAWKNGRDASPRPV